eukprot:CAMPEP_0195539100 /NCGR_PEP_ID=MMETSP0794_2-20130614/49878_1 /TAXON_ID=515487 /ORGANISM="Stephanopyxis turris, Strain CCMP 815" /LENGTH=250 /DNA_ID=CAMNT_0040673121 /DNA_START=630 /DNA_END=1382 /DNA_ORIENTATION=-
MTAVVKTLSPRRSVRVRKPCSYKDDVVKILNYSTEEIIPRRFVYQITKNDTQASPQFPRVLVSFASSKNVSGDGSNKNVKEKSSVVPTVTPDEMMTRQGEGVFAIISGSDTDESNHIHDENKTKKVGVVSRRLDVDTATVDSHDDTDYKVSEKKDAVFESSTKPRLATRQQTAAAALHRSLEKEMTESTIARNKPQSYTFLSKKRKKRALTSKIKKNRLNKEPFKIVELHTGTLYLYRGLNPRAEFVQRR